MHYGVLFQEYIQVLQADMTLLYPY
jgi:hypothetical protein